MLKKKYLQLSVDVPHSFEMVHSSSYSEPVVPVNDACGSSESEKVPPVPLISLHTPVPSEGVLAARVTLVPKTFS